MICGIVVILLHLYYKPRSFVQPITTYCYNHRREDIHYIIYIVSCIIIIHIITVLLKYKDNKRKFNL